MVDQPLVGKIKKERSKRFTILYYLPKHAQNLGGQKYLKWLYGYDVWENVNTMLVRMTPTMEWKIKLIVVDGTADMNEVWKTVDFYVRPTRHDGQSRMILECEENNIPYYFEPNGNPSVIDIVWRITEAYDRYKEKGVE